MLTDKAISGIYTYIGERIRAARENVGLSQEELGLRVSLTGTSISNIELGRQKVSIYALYDIAGVLGTFPAQLLPPIENQTGVQEKYLRELPAGERVWVINILSQPLAKIGGGGAAEVAAVELGTSEELLQRFGVIAPPVPVEHIAQQCGAQVRYAPYDGEVAGLLFHKGGEIVIGVNSLHPRVRQRFAVAHELGHLALHGEKELHIDRNFSVVTLHGTESTINEIEAAANDYAASLLVPEGMIKSELDGKPIDYTNSEMVERLADLYKVSHGVVLSRLVKLDLLN